MILLLQLKVFVGDAMGKLENKVAIVTGGTSGIGEACVDIFIENGAKVVFCGRSEEKGQAICERLRAKYGAECPMLFVKCDVSIEADDRNLIDRTIEAYGRIDILFNNAGVMLPSMEVERMPIDEWRQTFDINITGMFMVTKFAKPYLLESKGVILNNGSIAGLQYYAAGRSYAYSASKAAVIQFSHQMAKNYGEDGIRVNCICPGIIETPILHGRDPKIYEDRIPLGRVGTPYDVAKVALFLVSDDSDYLTGEVLTVDGGASL